MKKKNNTNKQTNKIIKNKREDEEEIDKCICKMYIFILIETFNKKS